ncbi:MAG: molybdate ABC transporter substrate-binding protein [Ilumatobacteraceae bacterium]
MTKPQLVLLTPVVVLALVGAACGSADDGDTAVTTVAADPTSAAATTSAAAATTSATAETTEAAETTEEAETTEGADTPEGGEAVEGEITVFAAASLTEAFTEIGTAFSEANPDATATFSFDASSALVTQITEGAPADVFASADTANMDKLVEAGLNGDEPEIFATNLPTIIVAPDNPLGIAGVEDLANSDILTAICAAEVPCGRYANEIFINAGITVTPVSLEQNVRGVVTKVTAGEADAGIVYETDVLAAGDEASGVEIPEDINVLAEYPIASVAESQNVEVADAFIEFVNGEEAQAILEEYGFGAP